MYFKDGINTKSTAFFSTGNKKENLQTKYKLFCHYYQFDGIYRISINFTIDRNKVPLG